MNFQKFHPSASIFDLNWLFDSVRSSLIGWTAVYHVNPYTVTLLNFNEHLTPVYAAFQLVPN